VHSSRERDRRSPVVQRTRAMRSHAAADKSVRECRYIGPLDDLSKILRDTLETTKTQRHKERPLQNLVPCGLSCVFVSLWFLRYLTVLINNSTRPRHFTPRSPSRTAARLAAAASSCAGHRRSRPALLSPGPSSVYRRSPNVCARFRKEYSEI